MPFPAVHASDAQTQAQHFAQALVAALDQINATYDASGIPLTAAQEVALLAFPQPGDRVRDFEAVYLSYLASHAVIVPDDPTPPEEQCR